ncbi:hypothetical protein GQ44DRAFT_811636 [Phaeosphaeriaceae sp. PMI808]|nr:hypothetical protein GQ44DRAFT_811636 [Phaeosphaeriaceae sp. PMI808]
MSSDYTTHHRTSSRQTSISSPLDQAPKFAPPSSTSRNTSPIRKPLHDRSNSQTNQFSGPTIRIVEDPGSDVYSKYPVPSEPSQILPPPRHAPGYGFERPGSRVSSGSQVANTIAKFESSKNPCYSHLHPCSLYAKRNSDIQCQLGKHTPTSPLPEITDYEKGLKGLEVLEEETPHPALRSTIRAVPPSSSGGESLESGTRALTPKASAASIASTGPASSPPPINAGNWTSINQSLPKGHKHNPSSGSDSERSWYPSDTDNQHPELKPSTSVASFTYSDISSTCIEPTFNSVPSAQPSPTLHEARTATFASGVRINYPLVRAPSANSSRAESHRIPSFTSRMQDRSLVHQWSSQLSTIASVSERDSRSIARGSRSYTRSQSQDSYNGTNNGRLSYPRQRRQTLGSAASSDNISEGHTEFSAVPLPLFSPVSSNTFEEKDVYADEEHRDTISPLPSSVPLRMKTSGYLRRHNSNSGSDTESRPSSAQSDLSTFFHNSIPAWARVYYQRGERISVGAPESESSESFRLGTSHSARTQTPSDGFPLSIYRPRNRPRNRASHTDTVSLTDDVYSVDGGVYALGPNMQPLSGWSTPHLRTDRRGGTRYSAWKAPSLDDDLNTTLFGRQNRQILLFCVGFIFPLAWMIASFLPLPFDPNVAGTRSQADLEQQFTRNTGITAVDDKSFQKATWWRNLNRIMSGLGTLLIGVIIALAILASRMRSG